MGRAATRVNIDDLADGGHQRDRQWAVRYLVVDTRNWWPGKKVLLLPASVDSIDWHERTVHVGVTRERIEHSPRWEGDRPLTQDDERRIHAHYGLSPYWERQTAGSWAPPPG